MSYSVEISEQANADLRRIFEYIAFELKSLQNATGQLSRLEKEYPVAGPHAGAFPPIQRGAMV